MTDIAAVRPRTLDIDSAAAKARIARRYREEWRFKAYGIAALAFAAIFIVILLADIITKALPAFTQSRLAVEIPLTAESLGSGYDPRNPATIAGADFVAPIRRRLQEIFPDAQDRSARRQLNSLLSNGAADDLRRQVLADPSMIGRTAQVSALLSDDADLYLKGRIAEIDRRQGVGIATPSGTTGTITLNSSSNDFASDLTRIRRDLSAKARALRFEIEGLESYRAGREERLGKVAFSLQAVQPDGREELEQQKTLLEQEIAAVNLSIEERRERAVGFQSRYDTIGGSEPLDPSLPSVLIEVNGGLMKVASLGSNDVTGEVLRPLRDTNQAAPGAWRLLHIDTPEGSRKISDREIMWLDTLTAQGMTTSTLNLPFISSGDSRESELAGVLGAIVGSAYTMLITLVICLPIGVAAAVYLEEFAPKNRLTDVIEVNINNLAAVPSIVFGLLGLAVFLNFFGMPRSAPLVGGLVLALLVLPTIIIASRAALKAVPPSIREAALGVGASKQQAVFHHVVPLAMPGILTGTIIGMAHALGETAPLLMIGMVAFIVDVPSGVTQAATVLPVQIFLWSDLPEVGFQAKTAAAILVLLMFLFVMNGIAIYLRKRFERRW